MGDLLPPIPKNDLGIVTTLKWVGVAALVVAIFCVAVFLRWCEVRFWMSL